LKKNKSDKEIENNETELENFLEDDFDDLLNDEEIDLSNLEIDNTDLDILLGDSDNTKKSLLDDDDNDDIESLLDEDDDIESLLDEDDDDDNDDIESLLDEDDDIESLLDEDDDIESLLDDDDDDLITIDEDILKNDDNDDIESLLDDDDDDDDLITIDEDILKNDDNDDIESLLDDDDDDNDDLITIDEDILKNDDNGDDIESLLDDEDDELLNDLLDIDNIDKDESTSELLENDDVSENINNKSILDDENNEDNVVDDNNLDDFFNEAESNMEDATSGLFEDIDTKNDDVLDGKNDDTLDTKNDDVTNNNLDTESSNSELLNLTEQKQTKKDINSTKKENNNMNKAELSKNKPNSPFLIYSLSIVSAISLVGVITTGVLFKDELIKKYDVLMGNPITEEVKLISKTEFDSKNLELIDIIEKLEIKLTENQKSSLEPILTSLRNKDGEMRSIRNKLSNLENLTNSQKEHLVKSIKLTLSVIENSKENGNGGYSESLYDTLYNKLSEDLNAASISDLDSLKIEQKNALKELRQEIKQIKTENIKLRGKVSKVEASIEQDLKDKTVLEMLNKKNNTIEITKTKSSSISEPKTYNIVGIVAGIAYILPDGESGGEPIMYQVNDYIPGYGKILNITTNQIIAEKGIVRKK
jgi:hypothetical protein